MSHLQKRSGQLQRVPPFCSERCKLIDLGNWASGEYVIPGDPVSSEDPDEEERP